MPVITRNQYKNIPNANDVPLVDITPTVTANVTELNTTTFDTTTFIAELRKLLSTLDRAVTFKNKMKITLKIYTKINQILPEFLDAQNIKLSWIHFICTVFDKVNQYNHEYSSGNWNHIDKTLADKFIQKLDITTHLTSNIITNYSGPNATYFIGFKNIIIKNNENTLILSQMRPRRNIKPINYTGMA